VSPVISVERLSKCYRLGAIGGGTLREDLGRWWAKLRKKADPSIKIGEEHRARQFGEKFWALRDLSFKIDEGDVTAIIGRNGAGKSTLLKILSRVTAPTSGLVKSKGRIASLLEVGTGFHPELTGRENVFLNGTILGMTKAEIRAKFDEIVCFSEIENFIDTPVKRYSSGMYVRLAFSVAAHLQSEILIVDEALAVGDAQFQKKCLAKMRDLSRAGRTVLFVSHNLDALRNLCRSAIVIDKGRLVFRGFIEEALEQYLGSDIRSAREITFERPEAISIAPFFCSASVLNHTGSASAPIDTRHGFDVELIYEVPRSMSNLELSIRISTSDARPVFTSGMSEALPDLLDQRQYGAQKAVVTIPGNFLVPGTYLINIALHERDGRMFDLREAVCQIRIEDISGGFRNRNYQGGMVMRRLPWTCIPLSSARHGLACNT
jgi:homopolymeric O-antigen transport system ATP-binding protein